MVCTSIRPTIIKYSEFKTWQGCAQFVSDHIQYEPLKNQTILPGRLNSPQYVLEKQIGHCFEYSTLLASLLIGASYNAYVVSGYATREICLNDMSRSKCPYLQEAKSETVADSSEPERRYLLRPDKDLRSQFLLDMEKREVQKEIDAKLAQELAEMEAITEFEKPPPDNLWTYRFHSWVLVLPSRDIDKPFFIECTSGCSKEIGDDQYHGIESLWNHDNYYVRVQLPVKTVNCANINFDLSDPTAWQHLLVGEPYSRRESAVAHSQMEEQIDSVYEEKHLDMPASWVDKLEIPHSIYEHRFPGCKKVIQYKKCVAELFAPYVQEDGLVERVTDYNDYEYTDKIQVKEKYINRSDFMYFCKTNMEEFSCLEMFKRGREDALKEHLYWTNNDQTGLDSKYTLKFYDEARYDGLSELYLNPLYLTQHFIKRDDKLYFRNVEFKSRVTFKESKRKEVVKITEKYSRDESKNADEDMAVLEFVVQDNKILVRYHYGEHHVSAATREYIKPKSYEGKDKLMYDPKMNNGYLTGPTVLQPTPLVLFTRLEELLDREVVSMRTIREYEDEMNNLLQLRAQEKTTPNLTVSVFDEERNEAAILGMRERERLKQIEKEREMDLSCDFLAPYLARMGLSGDELDIKQARQLYDDLLTDWKCLLVKRANDIQSTFDTASQELQQRHTWYEEYQHTITKQEEDEYFEWAEHTSTLLHMLEIRLNRHRDLAPQRYLAMDAYAKADKRLREFFHVPKLRKPRKT